MKRILLVRHGESEWNSARMLQGQADIGLSQRGEEQARALRPVIAELRPDRAVTSDLVRARRTAELLGHPDAIHTPDLREIHVGDWTGRPIVDLVAAGAESYRGWRAGTFTPPGGETWSAFCDRVSGSVEAALADTPERLLVVCHGAVIRAVIDRLVGLPPSRILPVGPASLTVLARRDRTTRLELFNFGLQVTFDAPD